MTLIGVCALGWVAGLWLVSQFVLLAALPWPAWLLVTLGAGVGLVALRRHMAWRWPLAALLCLGLGAARYQADRPVFDASFITAYADQGVAAVEGVVSAEPEEFSYKDYLARQGVYAQIGKASLARRVQPHATLSACA
jgi:hypothetical protein